MRFLTVLTILACASLVFSFNIFKEKKVEEESTVKKVIEDAKDFVTRPFKSEEKKKEEDSTVKRVIIAILPKFCVNGWISGKVPFCHYYYNCLFH